MDWGFFEDHTVYEDGKWKKLYGFLPVLGYSRMRYIEFVTDMSTNTLVRRHQNAFRYLKSPLTAEIGGDVGKKLSSYGIGKGLV